VLSVIAGSSNQGRERDEYRTTPVQAQANNEIGGEGESPRRAGVDVIRCWLATVGS
jgi:hypothetical protein